MTDEHLMRHWADAHSQFSGDLDRGLLRLGRFVSKRLEARATNSTTYACNARQAAPAAQTGPVARAALAGAMACLATTFLLLSVALATTAGTNAASGLAVTDHIIVA